MTTAGAAGAAAGSSAVPSNACVKNCKRKRSGYALTHITQPRLQQPADGRAHSHALDAHASVLMLSLRCPPLSPICAHPPAGAFRSPGLFWETGNGGLPPSNGRRPGRAAMTLRRSSRKTLTRTLLRHRLLLPPEGIPPDPFAGATGAGGLREGVWDGACANGGAGRREPGLQQVRGPRNWHLPRGGWSRCRRCCWSRRGSAPALPLLQGRAAESACCGLVGSWGSGGRSLCCQVRRTAPPQRVCRQEDRTVARQVRRRLCCCRPPWLQQWSAWQQRRRAPSASPRAELPAGAAAGSAAVMRQALPLPQAADAPHLGTSSRTLKNG